MTNLRIRLDWHSPPAVGRGSRILLRPRRRARLHLGCGDRYLKGYLNVDLPPSATPASGRAVPDVEADVRALDCLSGSLREIRLHHVLEHFERAEALALLVRWHEWLRPSGRIVVETPDFDACIAGFSDRSFADQTLILRHLFGSQEAPWAQHRDGWSPSRFAEILARLGYAEITFESGFSDEQSCLLANVRVAARKPVGAPAWDRRVAEALDVLALSMNGQNATERGLLCGWQSTFERTLGDRPT